MGARSLADRTGRVAWGRAVGLLLAALRPSEGRRTLWEMRRGSRRRPAALGLAAALLSLGPGGPARAGEPDDPLAKARAAAVSRLETVATWADGQRVAGFRDEVFERILLLDPDHRRSRAALRYAKASKGAPWVQSAYRRPPNWNVGLLPEGERRLAAALGAYRDEVLAQVAEGDAERRERAQDDLLDLMPEDETLRRSLGHVRHRGTWVLPETVTGEETRAKHLARARRLRQEAAAGIGPYLEGLAAGWARAVRVGSWRAVGSSTDDIESSLALAAAGDAFCGPIFGDDDEDRVRELVILESREEARRFLAKAAPNLLRDVDAVSGMPLGDGRFLSYHADRTRRRTSGLRNAIGLHLPREKTASRGWISEGLGQRLCWYVAGQHGPSFVKLEGTDRGKTSEEDGPLPDDPTHWLPAAGRVLGTRGAERVTSVLTMSLNAMGRSDVLASYALSAYLLEARPDSLLDFCEASLRSHDAAKVIEETLGSDPGSLARRVRRYALEAR
jgi:hypothetical protein